MWGIINNENTLWFSRLRSLNSNLSGKVEALNPSSGIKAFTKFSIGKLGAGWYRFAKILFINEAAAKGASYNFIEILIQQTWNIQVGCYHKVDLYLSYPDSIKTSNIGNGLLNLTKIRAVRNNDTIYLDVYSNGYDNGTNILLYIPFPVACRSVACFENCYITPETSESETIVSSVELKNNIS